MPNRSVKDGAISNRRQKRRSLGQWIQLNEKRLQRVIRSLRMLDYIVELFDSIGDFFG